MRAAPESIDGQLAEDTARVILLPDSVSATVLGEPAPPDKTPAPPPDWTDPLWKRLWMLIRPEPP